MDSLALSTRAESSAHGGTRDLTGDNELSPEMKGEYQFSVGKDKPSIMLGLMCTVLNT